MALAGGVSPRAADIGVAAVTCQDSRTGSVRSRFDAMARLDQGVDVGLTESDDAGNRSPGKRAAAALAKP